MIRPPYLSLVRRERDLNASFERPLKGRFLDLGSAVPALGSVELGRRLDFNSGEAHGNEYAVRRQYSNRLQNQPVEQNRQGRLRLEGLGRSPRLPSSVRMR